MLLLYGASTAFGQVCNTALNTDIVFVLGTSSDLMHDCQIYYFSLIIDLIENHIPKDSLRTSIVTFGTDESTMPTKYTPIIKAPLTNGTRSSMQNLTG